MWWSVALAVQPVGLDELRLSDGGERLLDRDPGRASSEIVGGRIVNPGEYPDAVGIVVFNSFVNCTGTLVAPNVVLTAGHCLDGYEPTDVIVGASDYYDENVEVIEVEGYWTHPSFRDAYNGHDVAVLKLATNSAYPPRVIADSCVLDAVEDGTPATMVGFGTTQTDGEGSTSSKHIAETVVVDTDCSEDELNGYRSGCQDELRPNGEIVAGGRLDVDGDGQGDGPRDVCFGDSGGPLYVHTRYGTHVMGIVSRAMSGVERGYPCRDGSVWARPDAVMDWLEETTGVDLAEPNCNEPPSFEPEYLEVKAGKLVRFKPEVVDPDSETYDLQIVVDGRLGHAEVRGKRIYYTADKDAAGEDTLLVRVHDSGGLDGSPPASQDIVVEIGVIERNCGCQTSTPGWGWLGLLALFGLRRRA